MLISTVSHGLESDPERRAILLCGMLFARYRSENDLAISEEEDKKNLDKDLPWEKRVTEEEAKWAAILCKENAPSVYGNLRNVAGNRKSY